MGNLCNIPEIDKCKQKTQQIKALFRQRRDLQVEISKATLKKEHISINDMKSNFLEACSNYKSVKNSLESIKSIDKTQRKPLPNIKIPTNETHKHICGKYEKLFEKISQEVKEITDKTRDQQMMFSGNIEKLEILTEYLSIFKSKAEIMKKFEFALLKIKKNILTISRRNMKLRKIVREKCKNRGQGLRKIAEISAKHYNVERYLVHKKISEEKIQLEERRRRGREEVRRSNSWKEKSLPQVEVRKMSKSKSRQQLAPPTQFQSPNHSRNPSFSTNDLSFMTVPEIMIAGDKIIQESTSLKQKIRCMLQH
ncbi:hypothetical protein SteCoe_31457 [Stentor coeruleus]|uniref:Uncharacterized protein n=1 Tax=Stentor coeruleus TaxID=5963 RepID=A0A1R2B195_9CILI|nr:hypothetical protein SteCoe_31457 [Stentor coeruleus]